MLALPAPQLAAQPMIAEPALILDPGTPGPAMWAVRDGDTLIYLFGTFHALDGSQSWFRSTVRSAFDSADELILETVIPDDPRALIPLLARSGAPLRAGQPVIAPAQQSLLQSTGEVMRVARTAGMSAELGVDETLRRAARVSGKAIGGLETLQQQVSMMSAPSARPAAASRVAPAPMPSSATIASYLKEMQSAWGRGDSSRIEPVLAAVEAQSPETYERMFRARNARWAGWIADRMTRPGTVFLAVGSGHLAGRDSVQSMLARHGLQATRIA